MIVRLKNNKAGILMIHTQIRYVYICVCVCVIVCTSMCIILAMDQNTEQKRERRVV